MDLCTKLEKITNRTFVLNWKMQYLKNVITRKKKKKEEEEEESKN